MIGFKIYLKQALLLGLFKVFVLSISCSQYNNNWVIGDGSFFTFDRGELKELPGNLPGLMFESGTSVSNQDGRLLFYTGHNHVYDRNYAIIGNHWTYPSITGLGSVTQGIISIPKPYSIDTYYLVVMNPYINCDKINGGHCIQFREIHVNSINDTQVTSNIELIRGASGLTEKLIATRHGNGNEWWLVAHENLTNRFFIFLADSNGIHLSHTQNIGAVHPITTLRGQSVFAPQGDKYAIVFGSSIEVFHFDRCIGYFTRTISLGNNLNRDLNYGVSFSPNGDLLYVSSEFGGGVYQFNMNAPLPKDSKVQIGPNLQVEHGQHLLGPNGKIYITIPDSAKIYVIHDPDSVGSKCNLDVDGHRSNKPIYFNLPNLPNFDLGPIPLPELEAGPDHAQLPACEDSLIWLGGDSHNSKRFYLWEPAIGLQHADSAFAQFDLSSLEPGTSRDYVLTITDPARSCQNTATDTVTVSRAPAPLFTYSPDVSVCLDSIAVLGSEAQPGWEYTWSPMEGLSNPFVAQPVLTAQYSTQYFLEARSPEGCVFLDTIKVEVLDGLDPACLPTPSPGDTLFIPNVFTPNGDGVNDRFVIRNLPPDAHLQVYDRWGKRVFQRIAYQNNWRATAQSEGTYYYVLRLPSGEVRKGYVLIMR